MNEQPIQLNDGTQLDPKVVKVVRTIRKLESGGHSDPYNAVGDNGQARGAYQFNEAKGRGWKMYAKEFLGDENADMNPANQNKVAYYQVKKWKDQGLQPDEIDALWNGAKKDPVSNKYIHLNADRAKKFNETIKGFVETPVANAQTQQPSVQPSKQPEEKEGFLSSVFRGITSPVATMLARPIQLGAEILGATPEQVNEVSAKVPFYGKNHALDVPQSGKDLIKDVGRAAETISLGTPVNTLKGAIGTGILAGAGSGLEKTGNVSDAVSSGLVGGALGLGGGAVSKLFERIPKTLVGQAFKDMSPQEIAHTIKTKTLGTPEKLLQQSENATKGYNSQIDTLLSGHKYGDIIGDVAARDEILDGVAKDFANSNYTLQDFIDNAHKLTPENSKLIDKFAGGQATVKEINKIRSGLDSAVQSVYTKLNRPPESKMLGASLASSMRNFVKKTVPDTVPVFDEFAKEIGAQDAIRKVAEKSKGGIIRWSDMIPFMSGSALAGPLGGFGTVIAERALTSPTAQFAMAKTAQKTGNVLRPALNRAGLLGLMKGQSNR